MEMVSILLVFSRAKREGIWDLYLHSLRHMLPNFFRYVHLNYASWGSVYISEMNQLPKEVLEKIQEGERCFKFNQVSPDHSLELLDRLGIRSGRIVGTTNTSSALSRWALSYNLRKPDS